MNFKISQCRSLEPLQNVCIYIEDTGIFMKLRNRSRIQFIFPCLETFLFKTKHYQLAVLILGNQLLAWLSMPTFEIIV